MQPRSYLSVGGTELARLLPRPSRLQGGCQRAPEGAALLQAPRPPQGRGAAVRSAWEGKVSLVLVRPMSDSAVCPTCPPTTSQGRFPRVTCCPLPFCLEEARAPRLWAHPALRPPGRGRAAAPAALGRAWLEGRGL